MAGARSYEVTLRDEDDVDEFPERQFTVKSGVRAFLPKDDNDDIKGVGIGRSSKAVGHNKFYKAAGDNAWIESPIVSRRHAALSVDRLPGHLTLINVAATHGLFVNGKSIELGQYQILRPADVIQLSSDLKRGEDTIPPRKFSITFNPASSPVSIQDYAITKAYRVPDVSDDDAVDDEVDDDEEEEEEGIYPDGSDVPSESASSKDDDSLPGEVEKIEAVADSVNPNFSDLEGSDDEAFDSHLAYAQDYDFSDEDVDIDSDAESRTVPFPGRELVDSQKATPTQSSLLDKSVEVQVMLNDKHDWSDSLQAALQDSSAARAHAQNRDVREADVAEIPNNSRSPSQTAASSGASLELMSSDDEGTSNKETDFIRRSKLSQMVSEASRAMTPPPPEWGHTFQTDTMDPVLGHNPVLCHNIVGNYNRPVTTSMSLQHILEPQGMETLPTNSSGNLSGDWNCQRAWCSMYTKAGNTFAPSLGLDVQSGPWSEDLPVNEYQEGPFASDKLLKKPMASECLAFATLNEYPVKTHDFAAGTQPTSLRSGISIPDIVDTPPHVDAMVSRPCKRTAEDAFESSETKTYPMDLPDAISPIPTSTDAEEGHISTHDKISPPESLNLFVDNAVAESSPAKKAKLTVRQSHVSPRPAPPKRRIPKRTTLQKAGSALATASIGALVGGLTVFSALAFLPEALFQ